MIVKNEAAVIERCIASVRPLIGAWCIVDTGSTDGTQDIVRRALADLPGELHEVPWRDFSYNRSMALELARPLGDYSLMIDADVECVLASPEAAADFVGAIEADVYGVFLRDAISYQRPLLTSTRVPFRYRGVLHEFLEVPAGAVHGTAVSAFHYRSNSDGARSKNPYKFHDDVTLLEATLVACDEPDLVPRYTFYLARSMRDAGRLRDASDIYRRRAQMGGWSEEVYCSWMQSALLRSRLGDEVGAVLDQFLMAHDVLPKRAEALCHAATVARLAARMPTAYVFAHAACAIERPVESLFQEPDVYAWRSLYELSIAAFYVGRLEEGKQASIALLGTDAIPDVERAAVEANLAFYQ